MSLCAALTGCLDAAPKYTVPDKLAPVLDEAEADPPTTSLYLVQTDPKFRLTIPHSVDDGAARMQAFFIADYERGTERRACDRNPPAGRSTVECNPKWSDIPLTAGCHTVTILASYADNFRDGYEIIDPTLATQATWFLGLGIGGESCFPDEVGAAN